MSIGWDFLRNPDGTKREDSVEFNDKKGIRYLKALDLWEISLVTFPANIRATVVEVKNAVENSSNERELEKALRDAGLSNKASLYLVSLCREGLFKKIRQEKAKQIEASPIYKILQQLKQTNNLFKGGINE